MDRSISSSRFAPLERQPKASFLARMVGVWRQRRALARLDAHARRDLGLSEGEVHIETARPIWDVPNHWRM